MTADKTRSFIRLLLNRELTQEELTDFFDIVDGHILTDTITTFDTKGNALDETAITLYLQDEIYIYEIPTIEDPKAAHSLEITNEFAEVIPDDFEIATTFS